MKIKSQISKHPSISIGILTAMVLCGYFLLMKVLGLVHITELRFFNFVILFAGVLWTMREHAKSTEPHYNYFNTLGKGCATVIVAVGLFSIFIFIYLNNDIEMMNMLKQHSLIGNFLTAETAAIGVFGEGTASGFILAYILLSYMKNQSQTT